MLESSAIIKNEIGELNPEIAVILGSGLENFFTKDNITNSISYDQLPDFPQPTVKGHSGQLVFGNIKSRRAVCVCMVVLIFMKAIIPNILQNRYVF